MKIKIARQIFFLAFVFTYSNELFALRQKARFWPGAYVQQPFSAQSKWHYSLLAQPRFINRIRPLQLLLLETGIAYFFTSDKQLWFGYRWVDHFARLHFQANFLWQHMVWKIKNDNQNTIISRTRFEEETRTDQKQIAFRFRQRLSFEFKKRYYGRLNPLVFDELFFDLSKTNYTSHHFFNQNRLFLGFNLYNISGKGYWEIGYINQYRMSTPIDRHDDLNHILSITYYFY